LKKISGGSDKELALWRSTRRRLFIRAPANPTIAVKTFRALADKPTGARAASLVLLELAACSHDEGARSSECLPAD